MASTPDASELSDEQIKEQMKHMWVSEMRESYWQSCQRAGAFSAAAIEVGERIQRLQELDDMTEDLQDINLDGDAPATRQA